MNATRLRLLALTCALALPATATGAAIAAIDDPAQLPPTALTVDRYAGDDRFETAARTALVSHPDGAPIAIVARGDQFPDGLAASYLAGVEGAPILLTNPTSIPTPTLDAVRRLGVERVVLIGGTTAIDDSVEAAFEDEVGQGNVDRIDGPDRFTTAAKVAQAGEGTVGVMTDLSGASDRSLRTAVVAFGRNFPDALAVGPLAHAGNLPILLTERDELPAVTRIALDDGSLDFQQVLVVGGPVAISNDVVAEIAAVPGVEVVERVAGADRTATAVELAELAIGELGWPKEAVTVSLGLNFPDALSLAPAASRLQAPILLTTARDTIGGPTFSAVQRWCETLATAVISGGDTAVAPAAERELALATACAGNSFLMDADQVADGTGDPAGAGAGWVWADEAFCYALTVQDLSSPADEAQLLVDDGSGRLTRVAVLDTPVPATGTGFAAGCLTDEDVTGDAAQYQAYRDMLRDQPDRFVVEVLTLKHPDGAIAGRVALPPPDPET